MDIINMYVEQKLSIAQVSKISGMPRSTIRLRLLKLGLLRGRIEGLKIAVADGRCITNRDPNSFTEEMRIKIAETKRLNTLLNSEKVTLKPSGYLEYTRGENKGKTQHRVVMEKHLGRKLGGNEYVHHINHIKTDNRLENLEVMDKCLHSSLHAKVNYLTRTRLADGRFA